MKIEQVFDKISKLDGIENVEPIIGGGQSYAFSAYDTILERKIFLKVYWYSDKYKDSLLLEPRKLTNLYYRNENSRNHIVGLFSAEKINIDSEDFIILRMEYCEGTNLYNEISEFGLPLQIGISIGKEICEGIHYLHSSNIVHRDIKPANIMVDGCRTKIIDLGSAMELGNEEWRPVTSTKTLFYNPPEVYAEIRKYGKKSDVFQIGSVLYEIFYGRFNFSRIDRNHFIRAKNKLHLTGADQWENCIIEHKVVSELLKQDIFYDIVSDNRAYIPKSLKKLLKKLTNFDPEKRFSSCAEVRNALSQIVLPNWHMVSSHEYIVANWKGKDYRIKENASTKKVCFEVSVSGSNKFRRINAINSLEDAIKKING